MSIATQAQYDAGFTALRAKVNAAGYGHFVTDAILQEYCKTVIDASMAMVLVQDPTAAPAAPANPNQPLAPQS